MPSQNFRIAASLALKKRGIAGLLTAAFIIVTAPTLGQAKELPADQVPNNLGDWNLLDRQIYLEKRHTTIGAMIPDFGGGNRFLQAFSINTQQNKPAEYTSISQRHAYYDALSYTLRFATDVPPTLRCIRFFDAATDVTAEFNLGVGDFTHELFALIGKDLSAFSPKTRDTVDRINAELHKLNVGIAKRVLMDWKEPRDPASAASTNRISGLQFDLAMVEVEQSRVEQIVSGLDGSTRAALTADFSQYPLLRLVMSEGSPSVRRSRKFETDWLPTLGYASFDFFKKAHRIAMGQSYVFYLHGRSVNELKTYRNAGTLPQFSCSNP